MKLAFCIISGLTMCCVGTSMPVKSGHTLVADYSYDGVAIRAFVAVEGLVVDTQESPVAQVEVRDVHECGSGIFLPYLTSIRVSSSGPPELLKLPSGVYWGRYLDDFIFANSGPDCIVVEIGVPTYDPDTRDYDFTLVKVTMRKR